MKGVPLADDDINRGKGRQKGPGDVSRAPFRMSSPFLKGSDIEGKDMI